MGMTTTPKLGDEEYTGTRYTRSELLDAFKLVEDPENWKRAIDVVLQAEQSYPVRLDVIREAVIFFTGSVPTFTWATKSQVRVSAAGYYATIGA